MNEEGRPNPEELLKAVSREESQRRKGKLKIFLGMAAGVGKTYAMLEAAHKFKKEGIDVVVGIVDTHSRKETAELLKGLEVIPDRLIKYQNTIFSELDIDAVLNRKPQIILIDELAHSNIPGSRHPKRWQDIVEILDNGIDVYSTLNIQHVESRSDLIESIAGIAIRETVPDMVIDSATSIELVDITPDELLRRLHEGKVYLGDQSIIAARNFFQEDRLTALREIVLRYAAEKVDYDLHGMLSTVERPEAWKLRERLLVAVSHSPHSQKLIRITRRLAFNLNAPWIALHVDNGRVLDAADAKILANNLALSRDLGAEVISLRGDDIAHTIQRIARQKSVTQIIIGRPITSWWERLFPGKTLMDRLANECSDIDLHVIRQTLFIKPSKGWFKLPHIPANIISYVMVSLFVLVISLTNHFFLTFIGYKVAGFIFVLGILCLSLFFKKGPIFFGAVMYALSWFFLFLTPEKVMSHHGEDITLLSLYLFTAIFTGVLVDRAKRNQEMLSKREESLAVLYEIVKEIASSDPVDESIDVIQDKLAKEFNTTCEIIQWAIDKKLIFVKESPLWNNEKEQAAANWVFRNGKEAGWSTSTLPNVQNLYIPLKGHKEVVGVLALHARSKELTFDEKNFLYTAAQQIAGYLERTLAEEKGRKLEHHQQVEKIYQSILNLISNLFEGPLLTIQDGMKQLKGTIKASKTEVQGPLARIDDASESLSHILDNISAMVNLSAGLTPMKSEKHDLGLLINICYQRLRKNQHPINWVVKIEESLPKISFDYDLIELVFYNLAFHAMEYALPETAIEIEAKQNGNYVEVSLASEGQTIPIDILDVTFEKFYRFSGTSSSGLGLGLAIAKTIADVHHGKLLISHNPHKNGMIFTLLLPIDVF